MRRLPDAFYNWISAAGAALAACAAFAILLLALAGFFVENASVYLGLVTYLVLPGFLAAGLALIAGGALWERRRLRKGIPSRFPRQIQIDLTNPVQRNTAVVVVVVGMLFLLGTTLGSYKAYHVTESTAFCGTLCHSVMRPEHTAYQASPHARVGCVACHIGPGADWFVKSKLSGLYQVYATLADKYPRPIPTPIKNLRPARETCQQCHWPEKFFGARRVVNPHYLSDEANTPDPITLLINIGGGDDEHGRQEGIHWHMAVANKVEYITRDEARQQMAWVRVTGRDGKTVEYNDAANPLTPEERAAVQPRTMDCMDCHNRPSHRYRSPARAVNDALSVGSISAALPYIKREAVKALDAEYPDTPTALKSIGEKIRAFYAEKYPQLLKDRPQDVDAAVAALRDIYGKNFFPEMKVTWRQYPDHIGHSQSPGCFRCHGSGLTSAEGKTITKDCNACHVILSQGSAAGGKPLSPEGMVFRHPVDIGGMEQDGNCTACHSGGAELY